MGFNTIDANCPNYFFFFFFFGCSRWPLTSSADGLDGLDGSFGSGSTTPLFFARLRSNSSKAGEPGVGFLLIT